MKNDQDNDENGILFTRKQVQLEQKTCWLHNSSAVSKLQSGFRKLLVYDYEHEAVNPVDFTSLFVRLCVGVSISWWGWLSTEHEQTLSDSTVYQWNIPLPFQAPPPRRYRSHSSTVSPSLSWSSHPSLVQFFISASIFLMPSQASSDDVSPHDFCLPVLACQFVVPPSPSLWNQYASPCAVDLSIIIRFLKTRASCGPCAQLLVKDFGWTILECPVFPWIKYLGVFNSCHWMITETRHINNHYSSKRKGW